LQNNAECRDGTQAGSLCYIVFGLSSDLSELSREYANTFRYVAKSLIDL
jgi:hypothetical protein